MCEMFFMQRKEGIRKEDILEVAKQLVYSSQSNADAWGIFNEEGKTLRGHGKFSEKFYRAVVERFEGSKRLVFHARLATNGDKKKSHPFIDNGFMLSHNGMVNSTYFKNDVIDSHGMLKLITESNSLNTIEKIKLGAKELSGSLSVFLMDRNKDLYYFKNSLTDFEFAYVPQHDVIIGATDEKKLKRMYSKHKYGFTIPIKMFRLEPEDEVIYKIDMERGIEWVGEFETKYRTQWANSTYKSYVEDIRYIR